MKISIITVTYNSAKTIQRAIESVEAQSFGPIEHVLVDGASNDGTKEIIARYAEKYKVGEGQKSVRYLSEPDNGIYNAINKGIAMATGDVIGFLHSDDMLYSPYSIEHIASAFENKGVDLVYSDLQYCKKGKTIRLWKSAPYRPSSLKYGWMPPHPTVYCRREVYEHVGKYDEWFRISADYDMVLRIFKGGYQSMYLPEVLVCMETGGISNKNTRTRISKTKEDYWVLKKNHVGAGFFTVACKQLRKLPQFIKL